MTTHDEDLIKEIDRILQKSMEESKKRILSLVTKRERRLRKDLEGKPRRDKHETEKTRKEERHTERKERRRPKKEEKEDDESGSASVSE
jgi:hypothetical protein